MINQWVNDSMTMYTFLLEGVGHQQHSQFTTPRPRGRPVTRGRGYGHGRQPISTPLISSQPVSPVTTEHFVFCNTFSAAIDGLFYESRKDQSGRYTSLRRRRGHCCRRVTRCRRGCRSASRRRRRWRRLGERLRIRWGSRILRAKFSTEGLPILGNDLHICHKLD